ncbi:MAG: hypothetical protein Q7W45_10475 [Bacteroidota bacterium]|nr:hypothetical protein [Bacteroidota bacterium]MDP3147480.1 hypothetical protein [Bacteroidota bacterium]
MKSQLLSLAMLTISALGYSQSQNWWRVNGNSPSTSDFIGTTNSTPLIFKTNNTTRFTLDATGNAIFNGNITAANGINFGDGLGLKSYTSSNPLVGKIIVIGGGINTPPGNNTQDDPPACVVSTGPNPNVTGWLAGINQGYYSSATLNGNNSFLTMYSNINNGNGYIDISGSNNSGGTPELFINNNCGRNTRINWLNGSVFMGQYVFMKNNLEIGDPTNGMVTGTGVLLNIKNSIGFHANIVGNANSAIVDAFKVSKASVDYFNINGLGITNIGSGQFLSPNKQLTVNGDVLFANNGVSAGAHQYDGFSGFEIVGGDRVPTRRGISVEDDPNGDLSFFINSFQCPNAANCATFRFKNGTNGFTQATNANSALDILTINPEGTTKIFMRTNVSLNPSAFTINDAINNKVNFDVKTNGKTIIGDQTQTTGPHNDAMLTINGKMVSKSCYIRINDWADYVFAKEYKVPNLYDVEKFYLANNHLPEIPSEKEVLENGIDVAEMNKLLLKKIEEITILMVKQQKEIDILKAKVN